VGPVDPLQVRSEGPALDPVGSNVVVAGGAAPPLVSLRGGAGGGVILLGLSAPLTCTLEGSPGFFADSLLIEVGAQVARPASARSAWSGLLRRRPRVPIGGISGDIAGALRPRPWARLPDETD
jgi:hypothetical protein